MARDTSRRSVAYVLLGDVRYLSRANKQAATLSEAGYEVMFYNGVFSRDVNYDSIEHPIWVRHIPETRIRAANFFRLLHFNVVAARAILRDNPDVVVCRELSTLPVGAMVKRARPQTRLVFDNNELSVETFSGMKRPIWRQVEARCLPYCDVVIHAEPNRMVHYVREYGTHGTNLVVENFPYRNPDPPQNPPDGARAVYFGAVMEDRGLEELLAAFAVDTDVSLDLIGLGPDDYVRGLRARIAPSDGDRIRILPPISDNVMYEAFRRYNIGIAFYPDSGGLNNLYCAPNKVYQYLQAGLAVVTTPNPGLKQLIDCHCVGAYVQDLTQVEISAAIRRIRDGVLNQNVTDEVRQQYCWESVTSTFLSAFE